MAVIARPNNYVAGNDILASENNANEILIYTEFNGNIDNANIKSAAAIEGSKLASAPNGIPAGKYNAQSIVRGDILNATLRATQMELLLEANTSGINFGPGRTSFSFATATVANYHPIGLFIDNTGNAVGSDLVLSAFIIRNPDSTHWGAVLDCSVAVTVGAGRCTGIFLRK